MDSLSLPAGRLRGSAPLTAEEMAAYVVAVAVWAPSVHNTQPWWFSVARQEISLHADAGRQLTVADPRGREIMISCGAALFTARLALRSLGYIPETSVLPDPGRPFLARWAPPPGSTRRDGVPHASYPARSERILPHFPGRDFAHGRGWGLSWSIPSAAPRSAGVVCLLTTADDHPLDWVNAGQALQRALLTSAICGVAAALHSQPLECAGLHEFIRTQLSDGSYPQLVLRFGTVIQTAVSVRRPPASVLFASGGEHLGISHG